MTSRSYEIPKVTHNVTNSQHTYDCTSTYILRLGVLGVLLNLGHEILTHGHVHRRIGHREVQVQARIVDEGAIRDAASVACAVIDIVTSVAVRAATVWRFGGRTCGRGARHHERESRMHWLSARYLVRRAAVRSRQRRRLDSSIRLGPITNQRTLSLRLSLWDHQHLDALPIARAVHKHLRRGARDRGNNCSPSWDIRVAALTGYPAVYWAQTLTLVDRKGRRLCAFLKRGHHHRNPSRWTRLFPATAPTPLLVEAPQLLAVEAAVGEPRGQHTKREEEKCEQRLQNGRIHTAFIQ